jgi:hypothetical protein
MSGLMEENPKPAKEVADEMLKSIGARVLQLLGQGGDKLRKFDDAYAAKVSDMFGVNDMSTSAPLRKTVGAIVGSPLGHGMIKDIEINKNPFPGERALAAVTPYAVPAASAGFRYGLPALGAAGLANLTGRLYDAASEEEIF